MALESSGTLSIGGSTTNRSINLELGRSATATSNLNETDLRTLAGVSSGTIAISNFHGKSNTYVIEKSVRFNSADSAYMSRTLGTPTSSGTWTFSCWVKRTNCKPHSSTLNETIFSARSGSNPIQLYFDNEDLLRFYDDGRDMYSNRCFRDVSAWYHIVINRSPTVNNMYINGTLHKSTTYSSSSTSVANTSGATHGLGIVYLVGSSTGYYGNMYLADPQFIDGQAKTPSDFGETVDRAWVAKKYEGTYGNNGWHLKFKNNSSTSNLGTDSSGNSNTFSVSNISITAGASNDSYVDSPSNSDSTADTGVGGQVISNYCVINRHHTDVGFGSRMTVTNGNLNLQGNSAWTTMCGTMGMTSGKWYWEYTSTASDTHYVGIIPSSDKPTSYVGNNAGYSYRASNGSKYSPSSSGSYGSSWGNGDTIGVAFDADNGTLTFYKNNSSQGTAFTGLTDGPYLPAFSINGTSATARVNFGQHPFAYTAPSGYKCLCTQNMPGNSVLGIEHHKSILWDGTGASKTLSGFLFSPDLIICNGRQTNNPATVSDTVRGTNKTLFTLNSRDSESTSSDYVTGFTSDGFTVGGNSYINQNTKEHMASCWSAGDSNATNTSGTITSTVRANTTAGFSIVSYTGNGTSNSTIGHGLGAAPAFIIVKNRSSSSAHWQVFHHLMISNDSYNAAGHATKLNETNGWQETDSYWKRVMPTSSVFTVGSDGDVNSNNDNYIAYCWAEIEGYSKMGKYTGNDNGDGHFIYTGFRPAWIYIKSEYSSQYGILVDTARSGVNYYHASRAGNDVNEFFRVGNTATKDINTSTMDIYSNGFRLNSNSAITNSSSYEYIYTAFAELPFKVSKAR